MWRRCWDRGEPSGATLPVRYLFAVQVVDPNDVKRSQVPLPHPRTRQAVQPRVVGNEANHALSGLLGNPPFGHAEETHVEVVQPLALGTPHPARRAVGSREFPFLVHRHPGKAVVGRIAQDHQDRLVLLNLVRSLALLLKLGNRQLLLRLGFPAGQRVGQEYPRPFRPSSASGASRACMVSPDLQVRHHKRRRHDLEPEHRSVAACLTRAPVSAPSP